MVLIILIFGSLGFLLFRTFWLARKLKALNEVVEYNFKAQEVLANTVRSLQKQHKVDTERLEAEAKKIYEAIHALKKQHVVDTEEIDKQIKEIYEIIKSN